MTPAWTVVILAGAVTMAIKAAGPCVLGGRELPPPVMRMLRLLAPALFGALIATQTFARGQQLALDARTAGLGVAAAGAYLRAPTLLILFAAAAATAAVRAIGH
jgi:branched-subunit amino acid transport protein